MNKSRRTLAPFYAKMCCRLNELAEFARALGVSRQALHAILNEKAAVTPEMALRLGKVCGNGPVLWLRMQQARDLWRAERELAHELADMPKLSAA